MRMWSGDWHCNRQSRYRVHETAEGRCSHALLVHKMDLWIGENLPRKQWMQQQQPKNAFRPSRVCNGGDTNISHEATWSWIAKMCQRRKWECANDVRKWFCTTKAAWQRQITKAQMHYALRVRQSAWRAMAKGRHHVAVSQVNFIKTLCIRRRWRWRRAWIDKEAQALYPFILAHRVHGKLIVAKLHGPPRV